MENHQAKSFKPLTISAEKLPASMARQAHLTEYAAARARLLLGCYRTGEANDPETYVAAITAVLAHYAGDVITQVTHPATGLPSKKGWLPTVKEVRDACDEAAEPIARREIQERQLAEQLASRREDAPREDRPSLDELKARYGDNWGLTSLDHRPDSTFKAPNADDLRAHYREYDLEFRPREGIT